MDYELEEMRQQMAILKDKLENQTIVNDRFIRRSIKRGVGTLNKRYLAIAVIALAMIPYGYWAFVMLNGLSVGLWIAMCVLMLAVVGFIYFNGRVLRDDNLMGGNLVEVKRKLALAKKRDGNWPWFGIPVAVAWASWAVYEMAQRTGGSEYLVPCCIVGILVGALVGLKVHFRTQRHYRDVLEQLEDLEDTK